MTGSAFETAVRLILKREGGYVAHPADRGGPTKFGITLTTLESYRKTPVTAKDVMILTIEEAKAIYRKRYWDVCRLDEVKSLDLAQSIFDQAVNCGPSVAIKRLQRVVRASVDGKMGPETLRKVNDADSIITAVEYYKETVRYYCEIVKRNPSQLVFLLGWQERAFHLLDLLFEGST